MMELRDKNVAIVGLGVNNAELPFYLKKHGARVTICDRDTQLSRADTTVDYKLGSDYLSDLSGFDIIFRTPGLPYYTKELQEAKQAGVTLSSQTDLFLRRFPGKVVGVTGTKGKGTTSSLIYAMLQRAHVNREIAGSVYLAGNIGSSPLAHIDDASADDWMVLELSSFQLQGLEQSPQIAVVLNITIDHLDHHRDEAEYITAKKNIVRHQKPDDSVILSYDSLTSVHFADETPATRYYFSRKQPVDQGAFINQAPDGDEIVLRLPGKPDVTICKSAELRLVGKYNLENACAAVTAAAVAGVGSHTTREAIRAFEGLPHRLQFVAEKAGVRYYDDSYASVPDAAIAAIQSFTDPITLIAGGSTKGADYTELIAQILTSTVNSIVCMGPEGEKLKTELQQLGSQIEFVSGARSMEEIVMQAKRLCVPGGVVLLSPGAASFDMFRNVTDRGEQFQRAVLALPNV